LIRFALISDVHVKNFKKHKQYNIVFDQVYAVLKQKKPDYILLLGDLFHSKNAIFAEAYFVASNFLRKLSKIAETHVILGNHEVFSKNLDRLDTLTPVIDALNLSTIKFHKYTSQCTLKENITLHTLSILDKDNWKAPLTTSQTNIALFHGTVEGSISE
jgi:predicted MPP superfamily phosphohydrolase